MHGVARKANNKKTPEIIKNELLASILEVSNEEEDYLQINEEVKNAKELKDGICLIKKYENLSKGANKKFINIVRKQGKLLKRFKEENDFFDCDGLSQSNIYFKIRSYKFLCKFPLLKNSTLTSGYFKSNFKLIKKVCKANETCWQEKVKNICPIIFIFFILVWIILSCLESFIHEKFYSRKTLSSLENFIHYKSYQV